MQPILIALALLTVASCSSSTSAPADETPPITPVTKTVDLEISNTRVTYHQELELLVFSTEVKGNAGMTIPTARGEMNGAPVLGYVFPTTLAATDVGFSETEGIVALAVTSHPDFDDTPL